MNQQKREIIYLERMCRMRGSTVGPLLAKLTRYRQSYRARLDSNFVCIQNIHIFAVALESFIALVTTLFSWFDARRIQFRYSFSLVLSSSVVPIIAFLYIVDGGGTRLKQFCHFTIYNLSSCFFVIFVDCNTYE